MGTTNLLPHEKKKFTLIYSDSENGSYMLMFFYFFTFYFRHLAPEYYLHGIVDEKTDVFAYGVFMLEVISGRKPVDSSHQSLHNWVK